MAVDRLMYPITSIAFFLKLGFAISCKKMNSDIAFCVFFTLIRALIRANRVRGDEQQSAAYGTDIRWEKGRWGGKVL